MDLIIIGAGAAGLLAAARAAERGLQVLVLEKNPRPGVKILMSGGTRCNLTQATDRRGIVEAFGAEQGPFLHSALARLGPEDLVDLVEAEGVPTKVESTGKIFPASNRADDILAAFVRRLHRSGSRLRLSAPVIDIVRSASAFEVRLEQETLSTRNVLITTGGLSYPGCGTTGDGYAWARAFGHAIVPTRPALTPLTTNADWVRRLMGVTIEDVKISLACEGEKPSMQRYGPLLLTHFGVSGPAVLDVSRAVSAKPQAAWGLECDFLPHASPEELTERLATGDGKRALAALVGDWLPKRLVEELLTLAKVPAERKLAELSKRERTAVLAALKATRIPISGAMGFKKAEVTAGGVSLAEVNSRTMQSKLLPGLFFAGEILDLDGPLGGYNFQAAFSTGALAGDSVE